MEPRGCPALALVAPEVEFVGFLAVVKTAETVVEAVGTGGSRAFGYEETGNTGATASAAGRPYRDACAGIVAALMMNPDERRRAWKGIEPQFT